MSERRCRCGMCDYCKAYTTYEMDLEFGGSTIPSPDTPQGRIRTTLHFLQNEEMCREFGTGGTTLEQRKARAGPLDEGMLGIGY